MPRSHCGAKTGADVLSANNMRDLASEPRKLGCLALHFPRYREPCLTVRLSVYPIEGWSVGEGRSRRRHPATVGYVTRVGGRLASRAGGGRREVCAQQLV